MSPLALGPVLIHIGPVVCACVGGIRQPAAHTSRRTEVLNFICEWLVGSLIQSDRSVTNASESPFVHSLKSMMSLFTFLRSMPTR